MKSTIVHNTISVEHFKSAFSDNNYCLYWQDNDGNNSAFICSVYGYENARRVAEGIGHEQAEFIKFGVTEHTASVDTSINDEIFQANAEIQKHVSKILTDEA